MLEVPHSKIFFSLVFKSESSRYSDFIINCEFSIPLCVRKMEYFIGPSLHNKMVQCFYYATNYLATCFDPTGPSSGYKIMVLIKAHVVTLPTVLSHTVF